MINVLQCFTLEKLYYVVLSTSGDSGQIRVRAYGFAFMEIGSWKHFAHFPSPSHRTDLDGDNGSSLGELEVSDLRQQLSEPLVEARQVVIVHGSDVYAVLTQQVAVEQSDLRYWQKL